MLLPVRRSFGAFLLVFAAIPAGVGGQPRPPAQPIAGVVLDATGAVLPGADVRVIAPDGSAAATTTTDATGQFRTPPLAPGRYRLDVAFSGFDPAHVVVTIGTRRLASVRVTMSIAGVRQEITVDNTTPKVTTGQP